MSTDTIWSVKVAAIGGVYMVEAPVEVTQEAHSYSGCELALLPISHVQICFDCIGIDDESTLE